MKTKAAVLYREYAGSEPLTKIKPIEVELLELSEPKDGECLVKIVSCGICHSDHHAIDGSLPMPLPIVPGHEAGVRVVQLGPNCRKVKEGDHAIATWMPICGTCRWCTIGKGWMCDSGAGMMEGKLPDGTYRLHTSKKEPVGQLCFMGGFSEYAVVPEASLLVIPKEFPIDKVGILGCAIPTGFGSAVNVAQVQPGDVCVVIGCGGIGTAAIQGARVAGASAIIAVDHNNSKLERMKQFGATYTFNNSEVNVVEAIMDLTRGVGAESAIECIGTPGTQTLAVECISKSGTAVFTGLTDVRQATININPAMFTLYQKTIKGTVYGNYNAADAVVRLLALYKAGKLMIDEMITKSYKLEDINQGFDDMLDGTNIRGMVKCGD